MTASVPVMPAPHCGSAPTDRVATVFEPEAGAPLRRESNTRLAAIGTNNPAIDGGAA